MQLLWLLVGLFSVTYSAVPDAPRREEQRWPGHGGHNINCDDVIAFSGVTTPNRGGKSHRDHIINFDTSLIHRSVGFSKETGIFTSYCPGLYQISFTVTGDELLSKFSLRKRPSGTTNAWNTLVSTKKTGGSYTINLEMEAGEQAAVFIDNGSLAPSSHTFSGFRISKH